jgi:predicted PhzF superfamily epimerase YddE/YHI9
MSGQIWLGRVFGRRDRGGNHTAVLSDLPEDPGGVAASLGFPDSAFVVDHHDRAATVRTFSPPEELAQCLQTALAIPVALGAGHGQTWQVRHPAGPLSIRTERDPDGWTCWARDDDTTSGEPQQVHDLPAWVRASGPRSAVRLAQGRSRLYVELDDMAASRPPDPAQARELCAAHDCTAVVFFAPTGDASVRTRVFTTSLGGREDVATGGAAAGVGALLARRGWHGRVQVVQGPEDSSRQGHLVLHLDRERHVGGQVHPLLTGRTSIV